VSKRIHCKGCGRWLFEVDAAGRMLKPRPRASDLEHYEPPSVDVIDEDNVVEASRTVVRCTNCGTAREWHTSIPLGPLGPWRVE
jgi:hypothetical protein